MAGDRELFLFQREDKEEHIDIYIQEPSESSKRLLILLYDSKQDVWDEKETQMWFQYWVDKGYIVAAISLPGYGRSSGVKDFCGPITVQAIDEAVSYCIERFKAQKVGLIGEGQGGLVALLLAAQCSDFSCIVCSGGLYNLREHRGKDDEFTRTVRRHHYQFDWNSEEDLHCRTPMDWIDSINTPLFILHRNPHPLVSLDEVQNFVLAIQKEEVECRLALQEKTHERDVEHISYSEIREQAEVWIDAHMEYHEEPEEIIEEGEEEIAL